MAPDPYLRQQSDVSLLFGRDSCSDAFGQIASNSICAPSRTLCCVRRGQVYPSCQQYLGKGWCCTGENPTDNCYVDQESVCNEANPVFCTNLAPGTTEACCPRLTSCQPSINATKSSVRCNIQYADLKRAAASSSSSSLVTSATSTTSTSPTSQLSPTSLTTSPTSSTTSKLPVDPLTPSPETVALPPSTASSSGLVAGAAIGGTVAVMTIGLLIFILFRRQMRRRQITPQPGPVGQPLTAPQTWTEHGSYSSHAKTTNGLSLFNVAKDQSQGYTPAEIMTRNSGHRVAELDGWSGK
ncbi:hypothetical protein B0T14DRAFT_516869 [Immersiella caudata]|uniref:Uncharacterized protein n=1 Tax=Immersiella caudata TaxID=314043 RepID=A0AA40C3H0_9PEZI|nr:hypothetical protein B0T14DRAFT_516869 [Immersiella caudata]